MKPLQYHESKQRGSQDFPLDYHYIEQGHPRYEMPYHWHEETEMIHVLSGNFLLMLDGHLCVLHPGDAAFISSGRLHGGEPHDCVYECVVFDLRMLLKIGAYERRFLHDVDSRKVDVNSLFCDHDDSAYQFLIHVFEALRTHGDGNELIVIGALLCFFGVVKQHALYNNCLRPTDRETRNIVKLKRVFEMIEGRPNHPPTTSELAHAIGVSPQYFCRFFKKATHFSPSEYIAFYRIEQACYEIAASDKNVTEIAMDLGYSEVSSFIHSFKQKKGISPGEYMKMIRTEGGSTNAQRNSSDPDSRITENSV